MKELIVAGQGYDEIIGKLELGDIVDIDGCNQEHIHSRKYKIIDIEVDVKIQCSECHRIFFLSDEHVGCIVKITKGLKRTWKELIQ